MDDLKERVVELEAQLQRTQEWLDKFQGIAAAEMARAFGFKEATADPYPKELLRIEVARLLFGLWNVPVVSDALPAIPWTEKFWFGLIESLRQYDESGTMVPLLCDHRWRLALEELKDPTEALGRLSPNERPHFHWVCRFTIRIVEALEKAESGGP